MKRTDPKNNGRLIRLFFFFPRQSLKSQTSSRLATCSSTKKHKAVFPTESSRHTPCEIFKSQVAPEEDTVIQPRDFEMTQHFTTVCLRWRRNYPVSLTEDCCVHTPVSWISSCVRCDIYNRHRNLIFLHESHEMG